MKIISARYLDFGGKIYFPGQEIPKSLVDRETATRLAADGKLLLLKDDEQIPPSLLQNAPSSFAASNSKTVLEEDEEEDESDD